MKPDEIPATTKEYWEKKKMKTKKKVAPGISEQMDPMVAEQLAAMRGNPNLRQMGTKPKMRPARGNQGARVCKAG